MAISKNLIDAHNNATVIKYTGEDAWDLVEGRPSYVDLDEINHSSHLDAFDEYINILYENKDPKVLKWIPMDEEELEEFNK